MNYLLRKHGINPSAFYPYVVVVALAAGAYYVDARNDVQAFQQIAQTAKHRCEKTNELGALFRGALEAQLAENTKKFSEGRLDAEVFERQRAELQSRIAKTKPEDCQAVYDAITPEPPPVR